MRKEATPVLEMRQVSMVYRNDVVETHALREFDLTVHPGEFVALTGPSGSGKTTFLSIAGLLETQTSGDYLLDGVGVASLSDRQRSDIRAKKLGFVFQSFNLIPELDLRNNVELPLRYGGIPANERRRRTDAALHMVGLGTRMDHFPSQLSGGQQQRAAIARAIVGQPRLLLADEPTGNLDPRMAQEILELLAELNANGTTIVLVTHDPILASRASRRVRLLDGAVVTASAAHASEPMELVGV
jgi:putative ABC transport system ATP-binding protein